MKKIVATILALLMVLSLAACGGDSGGLVNNPGSAGNNEGAASNGQTYSWRLASAWGAGTPQFEEVLYNENHGQAFQAD